jgi:undecaprenyl diphosphate synthase
MNKETKTTKRIKITVPKDTVVPNHLAIIPDGNRRWARARGLHTLLGHKRGFERAVEVARAARDMGIHTVSVWGFSTENWDRTPEEIKYLMKLYHKLIDDYLKESMEEGVRIYHLGRRDRLPASLIKKLTDAEEKTKNNTEHVINVCLDYGGQDDIVRAVQKMIEDGVSAAEVNNELFEKYIDNHDQPYPYIDLMIRTSGEQRTSGMLLWQSAYTEYYWEREHFPDFSPEKLKDAVLDFSRRRRRFGGNDAMEHFTFNPEMVARLELDWWRLSKLPEGVSLMQYAAKHLKEQFGLSKSLALDAAKLLAQALIEEKKSKFDKAKIKMKKFYKLIKSELKLAFEPDLVATLEVRMNKELKGKDSVKSSYEAENTAQELYAEVYRISLFQAAKLAHLRILASIERNLAQTAIAAGSSTNFAERHWARAEGYLQKYYRALKERVA